MLGKALKRRDNGYKLNESKNKIYHLMSLLPLSPPPPPHSLLHRQRLQCRFRAPLTTFGAGDSLRVEVNIVRQELQKTRT
jgi:hypothetical protein